MKGGSTDRGRRPSKVDGGSSGPRYGGVVADGQAVGTMTVLLEHFRARWMPARVKKMRPHNEIEHFP